MAYLSKPVPPAKTYQSVMNSAMYHLEKHNWMISIPLIRSRLERKTDNLVWVNEAISRLTELGYLQHDEQFADRYIQWGKQSYFGSTYIKEKLIKQQLDLKLIESRINVANLEELSSDEHIIKNYLDEYDNWSCVSKEKLTGRLLRKGFSYSLITSCLQPYLQNGQLRVNADIKAEKTDVEESILKFVKKG